LRPGQFDSEQVVPEVVLGATNERERMKRISILTGVLVALSAAAAETTSREESLEITARRAKETPPLIEFEKPNQITVGPISYSGIAIQVIKTDNLAQLINPAAPERYGSAEDNLVRDPITDRPSGLKIFSIQF
jgi:hypothetical protein